MEVVFNCLMIFITSSAVSDLCWRNLLHKIPVQSSIINNQNQDPPKLGVVMYEISMHNLSPLILLLTLVNLTRQFCLALARAQCRHGDIVPSH